MFYRRIYFVFLMGFIMMLGTHYYISQSSKQINKNYYVNKQMDCQDTLPQLSYNKQAGIIFSEWEISISLRMWQNEHELIKYQGMRAETRYQVYFVDVQQLGLLRLGSDECMQETLLSWQSLLETTVFFAEYLDENFFLVRRDGSYICKTTGIVAGKCHPESFYIE